MESGLVSQSLPGLSRERKVGYFKLRVPGESLDKLYDTLQLIP